MTEKICNSLETQINKILNLDEIEKFSSQLSDLRQTNRITQDEYNTLQEIKKKQLKIILDLNLLPSYEFICKNIEKHSNQMLPKVDKGEILAAEFEIIEREVTKLNLARVEYIQEHIFHNHPAVSDLPDHDQTSFNPVTRFLKYLNTIWQSKITTTFKAIASKIN